MFLKSLQMNGFKSFPDKIQLNFEKGITACVGPNGSGKSNVSDAVRWVLGEQATRVLRVKSMEDIIFNGTENRKALGVAEVVLVIDNTDRRLAVDSDEVAVCRRYYRSGSSEYKINGQIVRLKDVNELFMDTGLGRDGYSIIGQGKISDIVDARSGDRRAIFEEAAGISKYRYRKTEAERNLQKADDNLVHLDVILSELSDRVGPLEKEAQKAKKYLELWDEKRSHEIGLWLATLESSTAALRDQGYKITLINAQQDEASGQLEQLDAEIEELSDSGNRLLAKKDECLRNAAAMEEQGARLDGDAAVVDNDIAHASADIERIENELREAELGSERLAETIKQKQAELAEKQERIALCDSGIQDSKERMNSLLSDESGFGQQRGELMRRQGELAVELAEAQVAQARAQSQLDEITARGQTVGQAIETCRSSEASLSEEKRLTEEAISAAAEKLASMSNSVSGYRMKLDKQRAKLEEQKQQTDELRAQAQDKRRRAKIIEDLERNLEGFGYSVKKVMQQAETGGLRGIHGPVSRLVDVSADYAAAVEVALGAAMQNIIVDNEEDAKRAISFLKQNSAGRATFLPISTIKPKSLDERGLPDCDGYVGIASELVECDGKYRGIIGNLLGKVCVMEDMDCSVAAARKYRYSFRIVTLDGQVINAGGSMTGGSQGKNAGILSRKSELERLHAQAQELEARAEQSAERFKEGQQRMSADQAALLGAQGELTTAQEDKLRFEADLRVISQQLEHNARQLSILLDEQLSDKERIGRLESEKKESDEIIQRLTAQSEELAKDIAEQSGELERLSAQRAELSEQISQAGMRRLALTKETEAIGDAIAELNGRCEQDSGRRRAQSEQIEKLRAEISEQTARAEQLRLQASSQRSMAEQTRQSVAEIQRKRDSLEAEITEKRRLSKEAQERREGYSRELVRLEERRDQAQREYDSVIQKLQEEYNLSRREAAEKYEPAADEKLAARKVAELRGKIRALGPVNQGAIEEYKEVSERYTMYKTQMDDIEKSKNELQKLIDELTKGMERAFAESFKQINRHFGEIFPELFGGGAAKLELSDPEDCLNCGIEIEITQPGKAPQSNTESFSGGEKAIIAVAIYFAIMKVNPSPFCVLDEIDSALDEHNVVNIAHYIERMCGETQYVVITHRRGTMEAARTLYGVTKREGVSRLLELNIGEIEEKLGKLE